MVATSSAKYPAIATVHVTAQCAYPLADVSHMHVDSASHAAAPVKAEHVAASPASPHVACGGGST
jgi:hypothetical protein